MNAIDASKMNLVVSLYGQHLHNYCMKLCTGFGRCSNEANDLFSDVWVKVFASSDRVWPPVENEEEWKSILPVVARNALFDRHKNNTRREKRESRAAGQRATHYEADPHEVLERNEQIQVIQMALQNSCTPRMRKVVQLKLAGDTFKEIGEKLIIGVQTARQDWHKAIVTLRAELARTRGSFP